MLISALLAPLSALASLWILAHFALRLFLPHIPRVPLSYQPPPFSAPCILLTERVLFICLRTTRLNTYADRLETWLVRRGRRGVAKAVYTLGGALAAGGLLAALGLLGWTAVGLAGATYQWGVSGVPDTGAVDDMMRMWKRDEPEVPAIKPNVQQPGYGLPVYAIIPGVTVPLSHLPLLLVALVSSQIFHEFGHFVTAALEDVPVMSVGLSLTVVFPSAFVALSQGSLRELPASARLRVASAGAFHNLLLYLAFSALARIPIAPLLGYRDVSAWGRVVSRIQPGSPLEGHLPTGSIVTKIDDELLSSTTAYHLGEKDFDAWTVLLSRADTPRDVDEDEGGWLGWCVNRPWFEDQPTSCCTSNSDPHHATLQSCFVAYPPFALARCVDPLAYLSTNADVSATDHARCASAVDCGADHMCVRPRSDQALLRLSVHIPAWLSPDGQSEDRTVVWNGPRHEILEEVEVTTYAPRLAFLPLGLPVLLAAFNSYAIALNLSLSLFNLLPLAFLDGSQVFSALFDITTHSSSSGSQDLRIAALERGESSYGHQVAPLVVGVMWKRRVERALHLVSAGLVGACIILGSLLSINRL